MSLVIEGNARPLDYKSQVRMNILNRFIIKVKRREPEMDGKYNTGDDATVELKKALSRNPPRKNPKMSDAEMKLKLQGKKS
jgi:hypothetical protein